MKTREFEAQFKQVLNKKPKLSVESELALFAQAEDLLATRREHRASRETVAKRADQARTRRLTALRQLPSSLLEFFAIHPDTPVTATAFIALVLAFVALQSGRGPAVRVSYSDLPALPKTNNFAAYYDAQLLAERQAYEREVEDAHQKTSGGI